MFPLASAQRPATPGAAKPGGANHVLARAPRLRDFSDRLVASVVKSLQKMAGPNTTVEGMFAGVVSERTREVIAALRPELVYGAINLRDVDCCIVATLDATLVHAIVELLCGGNGVEPPPVAPRAATPIDHQFAQILFSLAAGAIQTEWTELGLGSARASKIEGPLVADVFGKRVDELAVVNVTIGIFGLHGTLRLLLPPLVLEKLVGTASVQPSDPMPPDPRWADQLQQEIGRAPVTLAAYLDAKDVTLGALTGLKVGQILPLPAEARSRASLVAEGRVLYRGELGQDEGRYSLRVDEIVSEATASVARAAACRAPYFAESRV